MVVATSPRLPVGLLSRAGWAAVGSGPAYAAVPGWDLPVLADPPAEVATALVSAAGEGTAVWVGQAGADLLGALREAGATVAVVIGSWDPPGARVLDVVAVMDRLRSPGGCPWDAEQTHDSLRRYLLEEAFEAYDALVNGDLDALREELGDVLLQIAFHARLAQEAQSPWSIDEVAGDLVDKLVRRHPHVFAAQAVAGAAEVEQNWEQIKRAEKGRTSVTEGLARSQPALALAQALVRRATAAGLPLPPPVVVPDTEEALGELLLRVVRAADSLALDSEAALRAASHRYSARLRAAENPA